MDPLDSAHLIPGKGIAGSAFSGGKRQVTLIEEECWTEMMSELKREADPVARRANVMVRGCSLAGSRDRVLRLGECRLRIAGETRPCERMDEAVPGLRRAMAIPWRGGVFAEVLEGGTISTGDTVELEPIER
ncbi:MAG: MOSC domain-containing protein [Gemmatimonadota bacterium]